MDTHAGHEAPVAERLKDVSEGISRLVREHVELAKIELRTSVRKAGRDISLTAAGAGLLAVGWLLLMFAIGYGLGDAIGTARAFLIISAAHVVIGFVLVTVFARKLKGVDKPGFPVTTRELERDKVFLGEVGHIVRDEPHGR